MLSLNKIFNIFLLFMIYSIIGYVVEIISVSLTEKKIVLNRGFLIGPYLPIYGFGAIAIIIFLDKYKNDLLVLFIMGVVVCSLLEYLTSFIMEKIFKLRWWDYSDRKFNINGRVCLENGILFGLGGVLVVKIVNPFLQGVINLLPNLLANILAVVLLVIFIADIIESTYIILRLKINISKYIHKDATRTVKEEVSKALHKNTTLTTRLLGAFPNIRHVTSKNFAEFKQSLYKAKLEVRKLKIEQKLAKLKDSLKKKKTV